MGARVGVRAPPFRYKMVKEGIFMYCDTAIHGSSVLMVCKLLNPQSFRGHRPPGPLPGRCHRPTGGLKRHRPLAGNLFTPLPFQNPGYCPEYQCLPAGRLCWRGFKHDLRQYASM